MGRRGRAERGYDDGKGRTRSQDMESALVERRNGRIKASMMIDDSRIPHALRKELKAGAVVEMGVLRTTIGSQAFADAERIASEAGGDEYRLTRIPPRKSARRRRRPSNRGPSGTRTARHGRPSTTS